MNAIGKVHLSFERTGRVRRLRAEPAPPGAFILIDPDTNNTVAGGMITAKRSSLGGIHTEESRVLLSLPADLADQLMATELFAARREEADIRRISAGRAADVLNGLDG